MKTYDERVSEDARLVMLKELGQQVDGRLNEVSLQRVLDAFAITRSRDWVRTQLGRMAELGAVRLTQAGTVTIAAITGDGRDHLDRRAVIVGITRPSDER